MKNHSNSHHPFKKALSSYVLESKKLEAAYAKLQRQFYELKENLNTSHQTLEQIITHMAEGLIFIKKNGQLSLLNPAACDLLGTSKEKLVDSHYSDHFSDQLFGFSMKEELDSLTQHRRIFLKLGGRELEVSSSPVPDRGLLLLLRNRIDLHKLEKGFNQSERLRALGEMAATLAHEIRNPLAGIEGCAHLLQRDLAESSQQRMVSKILEGTKNLGNLVTEVLDYAKPLPLHFSAVDVVALINEALAEIQTQGDMPHCTFKHSLASYTLVLDPEQMKCVLHNFLRNACEAKATAVNIELNDAGVLIVKDNGEGISQKNLKKIFTPFFSTKKKGTGLGLARALAIIKAHDATLEILSEIGKGTELIVKF